MLLRTGLALLTGAVLAQAYEPIGLAMLLPQGVAAFVLCLHGLPARRAWLPGLAFGIGFKFTLLFWMRVVGYDAWVGLAGLQAAFFAPLGAAVPWLQRLRFAPVWVATAWVAVESIRSSWPLSGMPWGRLAFATAGTPWQEALPYVGMTLVSFLLALLGALLARLVTDREHRVPLAVAVPSPGVRGPDDALVEDVLTTGVHHRAHEQRHVEGGAGALDPAPHLGVLERVDRGGVLRPDHEVWPGLLARLDLPREGLAGLDVVAGDVAMRE